MASIITTTKELVVELYGEKDGDKYGRNFRIPNPIAKNNITRAAVENAFAAATSATATSDTGSAKVGFFMDDNDPTVPLTNVGAIEYVETTRTTYQ